MAFWSVQVTPRSPYVLNVDPSRGRLHISHAALGVSAATYSQQQNTVYLQCSVGEIGDPVVLCSFRATGPTCYQLNMQFQETCDVVFSVLGPGNIHLSGYYAGGRLGNKFEPDGEDIADTESDSVSSDDYDYDDSFIDDSDETEGTPVSSIDEDARDVDITKSNRGK